MSFINKSVNYSQTILLKTKFLKPLLANYNSFIQQKNTFLIEDNELYIPNNNKKYYCLIIKKNQIEDTKDNYNILYFFNNDPNNFVDFYIEMSCYFNETILLEGYLYNNSVTTFHSHFLATDILIKNNDVVNGDYIFRYMILNELLYPLMDNLRNINDNINIGIHNIFNNNNKNMMQIFKKNFIYNTELCAVENINNYTKKTYLEDTTIIFTDSEKLIEKTSYADVYNVYDTMTKESNGILYIRGLKESRFMKIVIGTDTKNGSIVKCKFNKNFNKWEPIII